MRGRSEEVWGKIIQLNVGTSLSTIVICIIMGSCMPAPSVSDTELVKSTPSIIDTPIKNSYIGIVYPPLPDGIEMGQSMSIHPSDSVQKWSVSTMIEDNVLMLWLEKMNGRNQEGKALWAVTDVLYLPALQENQVIVPTACLLNDVLDPEILVLAFLDDESAIRRYLYNSNILLAWRADQTTGRFEEMPTTNIECWAETFIGYPAGRP